MYKTLTAAKRKNLADLFIRVPVGFHLIYGTWDNIFSWSRMIEFSDFLQSYGVPGPLFFALLSVYAQFFCGLLFIIGWKSRVAALIMIVNFTVALALVHHSDAYPNKFPAIMMLCGSIFIWLYGEGHHSLTHWIRKE